MNDWKKIKFEELYLIPSRNGINRPSAVRGKGFKMINMGEIFANDRLFNIEMELVELSDNEKQNYRVLTNDLIFARQSIVADGAGKCSIVLDVSEMTCFESHIIRVRLNQNKAVPLFYYYFFQSELGKAFLAAIRKEGVQTGIRGTDLAKGNLPYPDIEIQKKIAAILSAYDDLIENNLKQIRLLEEMAQTTYQEWFVRLKFPNHENTPIDETTGLPIGWEYKKLGEHVELIKDSVLPENLDNIRYIGLEHIPRKSIVLSEYGNSDNVNSLKLIIKKGDILFVKIRPYFHKVGVALFDCISSTDIIVMRTIEKQFHGIILQNVFSEDFVKAAVQSSNGTKMPRASWDVLKNYQIIIPEKSVLIQFAEMSDNIISTISNLANQNQRLKEARDILLPRLMTGKITLN